MDNNTPITETTKVEEKLVDVINSIEDSKHKQPVKEADSDESKKEPEAAKGEDAEASKTVDDPKKKPRRRPLFSSDCYDEQEGKANKVDVEDFMPLEVLQTLQQLASPKLGNDGLPCRPKALTIVDGRPTLPEMDSLQQCQHLQQIQSLIHYHEQQVKYRSYIQLDILRHLRKQLNDQMMLHPHRHNYEIMLEAAKNNTLTPLSVAERAQLEYFSQMADWTLEARASLQNRESQVYLGLFGRQVMEFKSRMNEITTHEQFDAFGPLFAERIDYHRELLHTLNRRCSVSLA